MSKPPPENVDSCLNFMLFYIIVSGKPLFHFAKLKQTFRLLSSNDFLKYKIIKTYIVKSEFYYSSSLLPLRLLI